MARTVQENPGSDPQPRAVAFELDGRPIGWTDYRDQVADFVPDPMVLRAADLFLMGSEQATSSVPQDLGGRSRLWQALDKNLSGILCFFDLLVTRGRIPLINYWHSFSAFALEDLLGDRTVRVQVDHDTYRQIKRNSLVTLARYKTSKLGKSDLEDVAQELDAFGWEWSPDLEGMRVSEKRRAVAQFLLGGLIFGSYAQASGTEHVLQSKRSRLFLGLSIPDGTKRPWAYERERELFEKLREACKTEKHIRYEELPAAPSVVPYLLTRRPTPATPKDLLEKALEFRDGPEGEPYVRWWNELHAHLGMGHINRKAEQDIHRIAAEMNRRFRVGDATGTETRLSVEAGVETGELLSPFGKANVKVSAEDVRLRVPWAEWIRRLFVEKVSLREGHSRVLLRLSLAQRDYENLSLGLGRLWEAS